MPTNKSFVAVVFTLDSLQRCLYRGVGNDWPKNWSVPDQQQWGVARIPKGDVCYLLDERADTAKVRVVLSTVRGFPRKLRRDGILMALDRVLRIAIRASEKRRDYPHAWSQYTAGSKLQVFAYPLTVGSERLVADIAQAQGGSPDSRDVFICDVTTSDTPVDLTTYEPDFDLLKHALASYSEVADEAKGRLAPRKPLEIDGVIDLEASGYGAVTAGRTFSTWLPRLSEGQRQFLEAAPTKAVKLRGPAGSGKTLVMELKALAECYRALDAGHSVRVLYATHSWAMAEQVDAALHQLDERGVAADMIEVYPLLMLAAEAVGTSSRLTLLGDDSFSGKERQLRLLRDILAEVKRGDWLAYQASVSEPFRGRVNAEDGSPEANLFLWDLSLEFSCVIGANGIMPGVNALKLYGSIERRPWMMPIENAAEREFVYQIYRRFVTKLLESGEITTDQLINDYLNYLSTFSWYAARRDRGYDVIFVDEFHLFNDQERAVFHHLTRDPNKRPPLFMAWDPRQAPTETYEEFAAPAPEREERGEFEASLGDTESVDLKSVFRFTPEIHQFLRILDEYYPAFDLPGGWGVPLAEAIAKRPAGDVPTFTLADTVEGEVKAAVEDALNLSKAGKRVALLSLDRKAFSEYRTEVEARHSAAFSVVEARDDAERLRYTHRTIVLAQPHNVAGLQFEAVVLAGCRPEYSQYDPNQQYSLRRFLSDLYLGASRAETTLHVFGSGTRGDFPQVIEAALDAGLLRTRTME